MKEEYYPQRQNQMKMKSLTQIFKEKSITKDVTHLKEAIIKGENFQPILQQYRKRFSKKQMEIIEDIISSDIVKKIYGKKEDKLEKDNKILENIEEKMQESAKTAKRIELNQLFAKNADIKGEFFDLKNALMSNEDITKIMQFYDYQLEKKELIAIQNLLNSEELKNWKKRNQKKSKEEKDINQKRAKQLEKIFNLKKEQLKKRDFSDLKKALIQNSDISKIVKFYEQQLLSKKQIQALKAILDSEQLKRWKNFGKNAQRGRKLNKLFQHPDLKKDYQELKDFILNGKDINILMENYENQLSKRQFKALKSVFQSKQFTQEFKFLDKQEVIKRNVSSKRMAQVKDIFKQIGSDVSQLMNALMLYQPYEEILNKYKASLPGKQFRRLGEILRTERFKNILIQDQKQRNAQQIRAQKINELFSNKQIKFNISQLISLIIARKDITKMIAFLYDEAPERQFTTIQTILNSSQMKKLMLPALNKTKQQLDELFNNFETDLSKLKDALFTNNKSNLQDLINYQRQKMPKKEFKQLMEILNSKKLQQILSNQQKQKKQYQLLLQIRKLFVDENLQQYKDSLVDQIVNKKSTEQILKKYQQKMTERQLRILKAILDSKELKDLLNDSNIQQIDERQAKINELLSKKYHFTHYDLKGFKAALLKNKNLEQYMEKFEEQMKGGQFRELKKFLESKQLKQILDIKQQDNKKLKLMQLFKSQGINIDLSLFIEAVINNEDTSTIIQNIKEEASGAIFRSFMKIVQGKQFKKLVGQSEEQDLVREKLSNIFEKEGFGVEIQPLKELILKKESTQQLIKKFQQQMKGKDFKKLQKIINSQQIKNLFEQKHEFFLINTINAYFKAQGINTNIHPLIDLLVKGNNIEQLMAFYNDQMSGGQFRKLKIAIGSPQLQALLGKKLDQQPQTKIELTPIQSQIMYAINIMFEEAGIKSNNPQIWNLKMAIILKRQYSQILNILMVQLPQKQSQILENLLKSNKFHLELKKIEISQWKEKLNQLMGLVRGIQIQKNHLVESMLLNMNYCNNILEEVRQKESPDHLIQFNQSISSKKYHQFFVKHGLPQPIIQKKHALYIRDKHIFVAHETPLSIIRKKQSIADEYKFFNLKNEIITAQTLIEPMKLIKCTQFLVKFQGQNKNILLPSNITIKDSKPVIQKNFNTKLQLEVLILRNYNLVQQAEDFVLQTCSSKRLTISYYINLILTLNQDDKDQQFKYLSHKSVLQVKNSISTMTGIKAQAQRWYIDNKEVLNNKDTLQSLGIKGEYFRITIIELKSLQYYGFMKQTPIKRSDFKDFFIEDDKIFCQNIINSKFPADQYSEVFRNQILGYIFAAIKKHSLIESSLNHIKSLIQSTGKEEDLWKPPTSKQKCYFNETFVLYYILRCSEKSLRIDLLRGVMSNGPVPLTYYDKRGKYVQLIEQNYWIQNKAFTIVSFGHGDVKGKSQLLNIIFQANFKNRDKMHKQCQGGIEIQYNIYKCDEYSVNLIDISNEIDDKIKIQLAKASNLVIIQTKKGEEEAINWINEQRFDIPIVVIFRDVQNAFEKENRHNRAEAKKSNDKNTAFNKFQIISHPINQINFYNTQINEIANGVQQFIRKNYEKSTGNSLWKFSDFLANHTNKKYIEFNSILKEIESSKDNLTKIACFFTEYRILEADTDKDNQEINIEIMDHIKKKAVQHGLASSLKKLICFYQQNFTLSSQIMSKIRVFLTLLRNEVFRQFNHLDQLLKDAQKKKEKSEFQTLKLNIIEKLKNIKNLKDSLTTTEVKKQVQEFIKKAPEFQSSKDWESIIKKIKNQFEFQIQPKAFSVQNFWREVIYLSKFDPHYEFTVKNETIRLTDAIISLGRKEVQDSQNFEVINGDLLQMPTQYLHKIFEHQENKKVMVVAIFGPQSSGKSTLLNFVLGCDFMSSAGRCTKGIYGTFFQICNRQMPNCDAVLVLDTQGLFSNYENKKIANRKGFDNKLVLFCLQVCDLIILNTKGDVTKECQQILQAAYDSESLNEKNLPELYFVLNLNGGQMNTTQSNQVEKFCDTVIVTNPQSAKFVCKNHAVGMPMAFNEIPRKSTAQFVTKYLKPKTLPSQRFYKETKNLCYNLMDLIAERGRERQGRTLQEVFVKMDQTWSTINKYPILTKHGNKKIKLLDEKINLWKKITKENFINLQSRFQEDLKNIKLSNIESWSKQKQKKLLSQIQKAVQEFQTKFPIIPEQPAMNLCIKKASIDIQPTLNSSFQAFKYVIHVKRFEKQIQQSQNIGFDEINYVLKNIKQAQAQSKLTGQISQKQKIKKFEECWNIRQMGMKKKIDRSAIAQESYSTTLQMYNGQLQLSQRNIEVTPKKSIKDCFHYQIPFFLKKLKEQFNLCMKNEDIFESSDKNPVMNIQKKLGDLSFKYLDMSKYFQNRSNPTFIKINIHELKASLDQQIIKRQIQEGLMQENLNQFFINNLCDDFEKMGVNLNKNRVKQATQYQVSNNLYKFFTTSKQLTSKDANLMSETVKERKDHNGKSVIKIVSQKIVFYRICQYFIKPNEKLDEQNQIKKTQLLSNLKYLSHISNFQQLFSKQILSQSKTRLQRASNQLIAIRLANIAIKQYANSLNKTVIDQKKKELQNRIVNNIQKDLESISLNMESINLYNKQLQNNFRVITKNHEFKDLEQFKIILSKFSKYWVNQKLIKSYSLKQDGQDKNKYEITVGFFKRKEISVKKQYSNRPILHKYINKQYNEFLIEMKRSNFTQFIRQELKYETVFEDIHQFAKKQKLEEHDLNQAIQKINVYTNELVEDINNDLKQVSQIVRYCFIAELHFYSCHLLWKMREESEWKKKERIILSFSEKKQQQLKRFLKLASGQPHLQNMGCAQKIIELYVQQINKFAKADREKFKKEQRERFKRVYTRDYVQLKIDQELNDEKIPSEQQEEKVFKYLLTPAEYLKQKYEEYYGYAVQDFKKYKYSGHINIIKELLDSVIQFRDNTLSEELCISDQIFQGSITENKEIFFIPLIVEVLRKQYGPYVGSENKVGLKIKTGKIFKIERLIKQKENLLFLQMLLSKNILITNLKIFLNCFADLLENLRVSNKGICIDYTAGQISEFSLSLTVNVCSATCPCCKRNCDIDMAVNSNHKKHKCSYGHQMRAIRGFRIESTKNNKLQHKASIQRCQDLQNDSIFNFNDKYYTWSQFKNEKKEWDLTFTDNKNEAQFANYWKIAGKRICDFYTKQDGIPMEFINYSRQNIKKHSIRVRPTNYIFALDESSSMSGNPWNELVKAIKRNISDISTINKAKNQFLSIFKFNQATTQVCQLVEPQSFNPAQLTFCGGSTQFTPAFKLGSQIIERHTNNVDNVFILISDGAAEKPSTEIAKIKQLQDQAAKSGRKVQYVSILIGERNSSLMEQIKTDLNGRHNDITNAAKISSVFKQVLKAKQ